MLRGGCSFRAPVQAQQQQLQQHQLAQQQHQQQLQQQSPAMSVMYAPMNMQQQQALAMQQQPSNSDNSGSGSYLVKPFVGQQQPGGVAAAAGMPAPGQPHQQQTAYLLSQQAMQPGMQPGMQQGMLMNGQPSAGGVAGLGLPQQAQMHQQQPGDVGMGGPMVHLSLQVTSSQFSVVSNQLFNISAMSGASLTSAPVAAGLFHINITGAQSQVSAARQLITSLLTPAF